MSIETLSIEICSIWKIGYWVREIFIIKSFSCNLICQLFSLYTYLIYIRIFFIYVTKKLAHMLYATLSLCHNFCKKFWFNFFKINKYICSDIFEHNYHPVYIISCDTFTGTKAIHLSTYLYGLKFKYSRRDNMVILLLNNYKLVDTSSEPRRPHNTQYKRGWLSVWR